MRSRRCTCRPCLRRARHKGCPRNKLSLRTRQPVKIRQAWRRTSGADCSGRREGAGGVRSGCCQPIWRNIVRENREATTVTTLFSRILLPLPKQCFNRFLQITWCRRGSITFDHCAAAIDKELREVPFNSIRQKPVRFLGEVAI